MKRSAPGRGLKVVRAFTNWGRGLAEIDAEFKFAKIQNSYVEGGGSRKLMLSLKFAKIQNSYVRWGGGGGGLTEIDAEFKFAKIQNSYVEGGWGAAHGN